MRSFFLVMAVMWTATAVGKSPDWTLIYGHWGHAPLYGSDIEVNADQVLVFESSADDPPKGRPCKSAYRRVETFEMLVSDVSKREPEVYDVFVLEVRDCHFGPYLLMAIPRMYRCHARIETYRSIDTLPTQEERSKPTRRPIIGRRVQFSAGYGLRFPARECVPSEASGRSP